MTLIEDAVETVLESVMTSYQVRAEILARVHFCGNWAETAPAHPHGLFHLVTQGECWIAAPTISAPVRLQAGDLIVFPTGCWHLLSASRDPALLPETAGAETWMLCGKLEFSMAEKNPIFAALPSWFVVRASSDGVDLRRIAELIATTAVSPGSGQQALQNKLVDSLFAMAVCEYIRSGDDHKGLLAALADKGLCAALAAIHRRPGDDWTIRSMADVAGMSRTKFAERFQRMLGQAPIQYLSTWRITEASRLLKDRRLSVAAVAERMGYRSDAAFRRFYSRMEGIGPGQVRSGRKRSKAAAENAHHPLQADAGVDPVSA